MSHYIVHDADGKILRTGSCPEIIVDAQAGPGEFAIEGVADDRKQKMEFDGLDESGRPVNPRLVDKTPAEIERDNPPPPVIPDEDKPASMTKKEVALLMQRVKDLEDRASGNPQNGH